MADPVRLRAHGKLNLGLAVLRRRQDDFHEIDTLLVRLDLHDEIRLERAGTLTGELLPGGPGRDGFAQPNLELHGLRMDGGNLALKAAASYLRAANSPGGAHLALLKRIPVAAGLGGGSSDAAAALLGMARLLPASVPLAELGSAIGSDVPFFLSGLAAGRATGRGERLERVELPRVPVVLVNPGVAVAAAEAYRAVRSYAKPLELPGLLRRLDSKEEPGYSNSLQPGVVSAHPEVGAALTALAGVGLRGVLMSGSGPTCFGIAEDDRSAAKAAERLRSRHPSWWVWSGGAGG